VLSGSDRTFYMEEISINEATPVVGATLRNAHLRSRSGALVLAIRREDGQLISGPTADTVIQPGDLFICMGTAEQLRILNQILDPVQSKTSNSSQWE
jgi:voltage-gated potassium channel